MVIVKPAKSTVDAPKINFSGSYSNFAKDHTIFVG